MKSKPTQNDLEKKIHELEEKALLFQQREDTGRFLLENVASSFVMTVDRDGIIRYINKTLPELTKEDIIGKNLHEFEDPEYHHLSQKALEDTFNLEKTGQYQTKAIGPNGTLSWYEIRIKPIKQDGKIMSAALSSIDITKRKTIEEALHESEYNYKQLFENARALVSLYGKNGRLLLINNLAAEVLGGTPQDLIGKSFKDLYPKKIAEDYSRRIQKIISSGTSKIYEDKIESSHGIRWLITHITPIKNRNGDIYGTQAIAHDITERKKAEREKAEMSKRLQQAQKMESLGTLAGGIAHDFNNTLAAIINFTELALLQSNDAGASSSHLKQVLAAANRGKDITKQMLAFTRPTTQEQKPLDIRRILTETQRFLRASLPTTIEIRKNIRVKSGVISADPTQIHQVLMNLCSNAAFAMRETGGVLTISLSDQKITKERAEYRELKPGNYLKLTVKDSGHGIKKEDLERIFEPFFTTKERGEGTGMGLSVVHNIIKNHEGTIRVASNPSEGTAFDILLPKSNKEAVAITDIFKPASKNFKTARILFVDDQNILVEAGKQMLEQLGYKVVALSNSQEALKIFRTHPSSFDLVITDMTMPKLTGADLSKELLQIRSDIPIILCTGFNEQINSEKAKKIGIREMLMKPLSANELTDAIQKALI